MGATGSHDSGDPAAGDRAAGDRAAGGGDGGGAERDRLAAARRRADEARERAAELVRRVEAERSRQPVVDLAYSSYERDRVAAGSMLAGAIAFRLFLVILPWSLVIMALLGFTESSGPGAAQRLAERFDLSEATIDAIDETAAFALESRWWALALGLFTLAVAARSLARALRITHLLAWRLEPAGPPGLVRSTLGAVGFLLAIGAVGLLTGWLREALPGTGLLASTIFAVVWAVLWYGVTRVLPHDPEVPWWTLVPGAVLVGVATQLMHLFTVLYLAGRVERMSDTYGALGVAAVILLWLFIVARTIVLAAVLDATVAARYRRGASMWPMWRKPADGPAADGPGTPGPAVDGPGTPGPAVDGPAAHRPAAPEGATP